MVSQCLVKWHLEMVFVVCLFVFIFALGVPESSVEVVKGEGQLQVMGRAEEFTEKAQKDSSGV